nr:PREDICTED: uncharacterized protein LOC103312476 isoform X2 [Tribolium castaneum]|eukprot:XP_015840233.1 PREDICTED: uncharacterized protein LOC103312476 isoform X2 [Tribolium castaneum]
MSSCCTNGLKVILNPLFHFWKSIISRRTYSQRRQHQAARKIQQFMRQSKNNLWDETMGSVVTERTSRKREAGGPVSGCPSKVTVSRGLLHLHRPK